MNFDLQITAALLKTLSQFPTDQLFEADISPNASQDLNAENLMHSLAESHYEAVHGVEMPDDITVRDYIATL